MFFSVKILLIQPLKNQKSFYPTSNINKKTTHPWPKSLQKDTIQLSHMSFIMQLNATAACVCSFFAA
jgi:hypothetical protein